MSRGPGFYIYLARGQLALYPSVSYDTVFTTLDLKLQFNS